VVELVLGGTQSSVSGGSVLTGHWRTHFPLRLAVSPRIWTVMPSRALAEICYEVGHAPCSSQGRETRHTSELSSRVQRLFSLCRSPLDFPTIRGRKKRESAGNPRERERRVFVCQARVAAPAVAWIFSRERVALLDRSLVAGGFLPPP
jgi:hypothetical protein